MPATLLQPEKNSAGQKYIFLPSLRQVYDYIRSINHEAASALENWFENNGTSYAQVSEKGNVINYRFLYGFDIKKLENDARIQTPLTPAQVDLLISAVLSACEKKTPGSIIPRANDEDMPFMKKKDDGLRNI